MASTCPLCYRVASPTCCEEDGEQRAAFALLQRQRAALLERFAIESRQNPRFGGHDQGPHEWETHPDLDSLFDFLDRLSRCICLTAAPCHCPALRAR